MDGLQGSLSESQASHPPYNGRSDNNIAYSTTVKKGERMISLMSPHDFSSAFERGNIYNTRTLSNWVPVRSD